MNIRLHNLKIDTSSFRVIRGFEEAEREDRNYYKSLTPRERLQIAEHLRSITYDNDAQGLQRVFEITQRKKD